MIHLFVTLSQQPQILNVDLLHQGINIYFLYSRLNLLLQLHIVNLELLVLLGVEVIFKFKLFSLDLKLILKSNLLTKLDLEFDNLLSVSGTESLVLVEILRVLRKQLLKSDFLIKHILGLSLLISQSCHEVTSHLFLELE